MNVGPYEVLAELARGGMGVVYRARDPASGRELALKTLLGGGANARRKQRFLREGELTAALEHPGIVRVFACGEEAGHPWLAYELVEDCRQLDQVWEGLPLPQRVGLVLQVAQALGFAHARGVVHRDVKPANVLVDGAGRARVADFGLAAGTDLEQMTRTGELLGTPTHMAPEQLSGSDRSPRIDVWATGVLLYQALTGALPFEALTALGLMQQLAEGKVKPPRARNPEVSPGLEAVCLQALCHDPAGRYPDCGALAQDLERALQGGSTAAGSPWRALTRSLAERRRSLALALPLLGALGFTGWVLLGGGAPVERPPSSPSPPAHVAQVASAPAPAPASSPSPSPSQAHAQDPGPPRPLDPRGNVALEVLLEAARKGKRQALWEIAEAYRSGDKFPEVPLDLETAAYWYQKAWEAGHPMARVRQCRLLWVEGREDAFLTRVRELEASDVPEEAQGAHQLHHEFLQTNPARQDPEWIARGLAAGCPTCALVTAQGLEDGPRKLELLEQAADGNVERALQELGDIYCRGDCGVQVDPERAASYFLRLAELDNVAGMVQYAQLQLNGALAHSDPAMARLWLDRAQREGSPKAEQLLRHYFAD